MDVHVGPKNLKYLRKCEHQCENLIRDRTPRVMGPWPLSYYHTSFSSGTKCGISFMVVGQETFKILNKMWSQGITELQNKRMTEGHG